MTKGWRRGQVRLPNGTPDNLVLIRSLMALCEEEFGCEECPLPCLQLYDRFCGRLCQGKYQSVTSLETLRFLAKFSDLINPMIEARVGGNLDKVEGGG